MRIRRPRGGIHEGDLTPMIDMTFQLIAFFMVLINFTQSEQDQRIQLPDSTLAKPPEQPLDFPITLHVTKEGTIILGGHDVQLLGLKSLLLKETSVLATQGKQPSDATVIIRAHRGTKTGRVQEVIQICQENRFDRFALRAKEDVGN
ncbi:MAG: biopolymer transporter ExbD [Pirellulaceae bacterium]|jgi:biopolymer transport protein ExbD|nr:biopolymer transporter ExbD [Pirellulaceae bacterium]MDP7017582.1 biopolymer transporter ExbD [Pirellulaceae bacterium]